MNIEERLREIIREELKPVLDALQPTPPIQGDTAPPDKHQAPLPAGGDVVAAFAVLKTDQQRAAFVAALPPIDPSRWLSTCEAAAQLGMKPGTLENWRAQGRGPAFRRIGRAIRYDRAVIEGYMG